VHRTVFGLRFSSKLWENWYTFRSYVLVFFIIAWLKLQSLNFVLKLSPNISKIAQYDILKEYLSYTELVYIYIQENTMCNYLCKECSFIGNQYFTSFISCIQSWHLYFTSCVCVYFCCKTWYQLVLSLSFCTVKMIPARKIIMCVRNTEIV